MQEALLNGGPMPPPQARLVPEDTEVAIRHNFMSEEALLREERG